jgi:N-methylhydantoinase A
VNVDSPTSGPAPGALYIGVDIGGTFTDLVVMDATGGITIEKVPTTPERLEQGVMDGLERLADARDMPLDRLLARVEAFGHGTTQATNVLVERNGANTGLITTLGFGDTLVIQRLLGFTAGVPSQELGYYSRRRLPDPIVPRCLVREVAERVDQSGRVLLALDEAQVRAAITSLLEEHGIDALAVALLWSFRNPEHERRIREIACEVDDRLQVSLSCEVAPVIGEYERMATTALNAYVGARVASYLGRLEQRLRARGFDGAFRVLNSVGGVMSVEDAVQRPVLLLGSGPTGGVIGSRHLAKELGDHNIITTDMGGTSFDVGLVVGGQPVVSAITEVGKYHVAAPMIQIRAIGAGGGSIATVRDGLLKVGPASAGASPGPVCYGRGGDKVTVTDADLVLGIISESAFLGGRMPLDRSAAAAAIERQIAGPLGLAIEEAAAGIRRVVGSQMADALRELTIGRGHDPRDFALYVYGGAGPAHAADFGRELGVAKIIIPATSMVQSAYGALASDVLHTAELSVMLRGGGGARDAWEGIDPSAIEEHYERLEVTCRALLAADGVAAVDIELTRSADVRYRRQTHELIIEYDDASGNGRGSIEALVRRFERAYEETYGKGSGFREAGIEITTLRVRARGRTPKPQLADAAVTSGGAHPSERMVYDSVRRDFVLTAIHQWADLGVGDALRGPAVVEHASTTVFIGDTQEAHVDRHGNLIVQPRIDG